MRAAHHRLRHAPPSAARIGARRAWARVMGLAALDAGVAAGAVMVTLTLTPMLTLTVALALGAAGPARAADQAQALRVEASEPRAYGYQVGDVVPRSITVHAPPGWRLVQDSLPRPGGRGAPIELRSVTAQVHRAGAGQRHELQLDYQVLFAPTGVRTLEIAPLRLRFEHATRSEELRVEGAPVTVAPLAPLEVSPRRGLGELQPDREPPLIATGAAQMRLLLGAALAGLALCTLALLSVGPPWRAARNRPFARAWRELRRLPARPEPEQWRAACRSLHQALNASAGEVLFEPGLERFIGAHPKFRPERDSIARFMQVSREVFFADAAPPGSDAGPRPPGDAHEAAWLIELCRRCEEAERSWTGAR
jgi:mxaA protein